MSTSETKTKNMIFVFVSAHVIRTLFLVTAHEFHETKIWFFVSVFRVLKGVALGILNFTELKKLYKHSHRLPLLTITYG